MQQVTTIPQTIEQPRSGASFGLRMVAQIIDLILHNLIAYIIAFTIGIGIAIYASMSEQSSSLLVDKLQNNSIVWYLFPLAGYVVYHTISEGFYGATLGKLIMKLRVVQQDGTPCTAGAALVRSIAFYIDSLFFGLVGALSMNRTELKQRYGDVWAHTIVVERSQWNQTPMLSGWMFLIVFLIAVIADGFIYAVSLLLKLLV